MQLAKVFFFVALWLAGVSVGSSTAAPSLEEHVTSGSLDLVWVPGFGLPSNMKPLVLAASHPAFLNPSGDHSVACATNTDPTQGGVIKTLTDPGGISDYQWEAWIFTGDGNTRRGLVVRADSSNGFASCYQFVIQAGLFQLNFRKLINGSPTTLGTWFATSLASGVPAVNTWHHMKVIAQGSSFRVFWDGQELSTSAIVDADLPQGFVGVYNFRFDLGGVEFLTDDLLLTPAGPVQTRQTTWGRLKAERR